MRAGSCKSFRRITGRSEAELASDRHDRLTSTGNVKHGLPHFTTHDFRRTARIHLAALGVDPHVAERCLNHKLKGVEGIYNRHDYFAERMVALEGWGQLLIQLEQGESSKVIPIAESRRVA